jgi:hypothetical protein
MPSAASVMPTPIRTLRTVWLGFDALNLLHGPDLSESYLRFRQLARGSGAAAHGWKLRAVPQPAAYYQE